MPKYWILFAIVICIIKSSSAFEIKGLQNDLLLVENFFQKLTNDHGSILPGQDLTKAFDAKIAKFLQMTQRPLGWRHRRHLDGHVARLNNGIGVLKGFSGIFEDPFPNSLAISIFAYYNGNELQWFTVTLDASLISLYRYNGNQFEKACYYLLTGGSHLIADCSEFGCVFVIGKIDGSVTILRLQREVHKYILHPVQDLEGLGDVRLSIWHGMNQMFLGIASNANVSIYQWLGEHFDSIQVLNYGTGKLTPFKIGGSMYLTITGTQTTTVLKFILQSNVFVLTQRLPPANDAESFYMEKGHQREHYLALSNQDSTIMYKFVHDHFVPFQNIENADWISSITTKETVVLLALKRGLLKIYQYNGWKFVELGITMAEIDQIYPTYLDGEVILIVKHKNAMWSFKKLIWVQQSTWEILRDKTKLWCLEIIEKAKTQPPVRPKFNGAVKIQHGHIGKLQAKKVKGRGMEQLINLSNQFTELRSGLLAKKQLFSQFVLKKNPKINTLYASKVHGQCTLGCRINRLSTAVKSELLKNLAKPNVIDQVLVFENVKAQLTGTLPCPKSAVLLKSVTVSNRINGITFASLQNDLLKVSGDQEVTGHHIYNSLSVSNVLVPLGIATQLTHQEINAISIKANNLYLVQGGILLPLNGPPVTINDTKTVSKVKVTGPVHLRGKLNGDGVKDLKPVTWIEKPLILRGNYSLRKVTVTNQAKASDLLLDRKRSLTQIRSEALRLDESVPVHLKLSKLRTTWTKITADITADWVTALSDKSITNHVKNITGTKRSPNDVIITSLSYDALPLPKFQSSFCALEATIANIETWSVEVDEASAKTLKAVQMFGASTLSSTIMDTATITTANKLNLASKIFSGTVEVHQALLDDIAGIDFQRLWVAMNAWRNPGTINGVVNASNLDIKHLLAAKGFVPPSITNAKNFISKGNIYFETLNQENISALAQNIVKLDETASLTNIAFAGGLVARTFKTLVAPIDLSGTRNMGTKIIAGSLKSANLILPYSFTYSSSNTPTNLIVKGSITFAVEPKIQSINGLTLQKLFDNIWFINKPCILSNALFDLRHAVFKGPVQILGWLNTQNYGPWNQISKWLLSRTRSQEIYENVYLKKAKIPNIICTKGLSLLASASFLAELVEHSLKRDSSQTVSNAMHFQTLIVLDDLNTQSKINGKDLSIDIVRFDVKENIITGKKTVLSLHAENFNGGFNFGSWQTNTLSVLNNGKPIIVRGLKTFANITLLKPLQVDGMVNGCAMKKYLLKSISQQVGGTKKIHGTIITSKIVIDGQVNDIDLSSLVKHQLKKNKQVQIIKSQIIMRGDVTIMGDAAVNRLFHGVELKNLDRLTLDLELVSARMVELSYVAKQIHISLSRRAWYCDKLELIKVNSTALTSGSSIFHAVLFEGLGNCLFKIGVLTCDGETVQLLTFPPNSSRVLFSQVFQLEGIPLVVVATSDPNGGVWIYTYEHVEKKFRQVAGFNLPGATQASAIVSSGSLWLAVQLTWDTIILRYDTWGQFEEYTLPGSEFLLMEVAPTGEPLIFQSDGVWKLGGLSGPRQLIATQLNGKIGTYRDDNDYYVQVIRNSNARLLKTRYVGN
ncbi:uncharacterized protein LOC124306826 isoform X1 [Neodiprion virginianus]|uniref:uncharacterized protein LOC124306826 isoform X1 n=1 Tax=Neodiprion virginianus TaxID=2961670 RepID=UPI001EE6C942|nr:uncharacterized protein LOC124306826 isoform X1 [Neodiprion virginianus]